MISRWEIKRIIDGEEILIPICVSWDRGYYILTIDGYYSGRAISEVSLANIIKIQGVENDSPRLDTSSAR